MSALLSLPVFVLCGLSALLVGCGRRIAPRLVDLAVVSGALYAGVVAAQFLVGTAPAGALGSLVGIAASLALLRIRHGGLARPGRSLGVLLSPYAVLLAGILLSRVALSSADLGAAETLLTSPALWLAVANLYALVAVLPGEHRAVAAAALTQWWPVTATTLLFFYLGTTLTASGMSSALADAAAHLGPVYPLAAPWIGAVGGFLTGSNSGGNAMFAAGQAETAESIHRSATVMVAVQNVSGSLLTMASLPRVALAEKLAEAPEPAPRPSATAGQSSKKSADDHRPSVLRTVLLTGFLVLTVLSLTCFVVS
ncbi:L-lactate permease [Nocardia takedensis]|uniref:L-lactate permease n=1 Tax=Nocardia takedensis TaxID=259390 RepID=UPI0002F6BF20|nr:L-lactate permease [Nocardia takedensis]